MSETIFRIKGRLEAARIYESAIGVNGQWLNNDIFERGIKVTDKIKRTVENGTTMKK